MDNQNLNTSTKSQKNACGSAKCSACVCAEPLGSTYIDTVSASVLTGLSPRALDTLRYRGGGPRYVRIGRRIRYRSDDLRAWMESDAVPSAGTTIASGADRVGADNG